MAVKRAAAATFRDMIDELAAGTDGCKRRRFGSTDDYDKTCGLGKGGFGVVVKARHRPSGQDVALKSFHGSPGGKNRADVARDLLREACFLAACRAHPSLVSFHGIVRDPRTGECSLVLEHVGPSLEHVLRERRGGRRPFTEDEVRRVMRQLLSGTKRMHERRIVHRDIKPANILVGDGGDVVKICDLGLAMLMNAKPPYKQAGTLWYMAPEMLLEKPDYVELVDAWSLGCVMAELLAGTVLFRGQNAIDQLQRIFVVLGTPGYKTWPGYASLPLAAAVPQPRTPRPNRLREVFPEGRLSRDGFEVLDGLLTCNPEKRLSADMALQCPWFTDNVDAPSAAKTGVPALPTQEAACFTAVSGC